MALTFTKRAKMDARHFTLLVSLDKKKLQSFLLEKGADPYARTEGNLPFTEARLSGNDEICELLKPYMAKHEGDESSRKRQKHLGKLDSSIKELERQIEKHCGGEGV
jgi:hypothetical protein